MTLVVHVRHDPYHVYCGRAGKGEDGYHGNPVRVGHDCPVCGGVHDTPASTLTCFGVYFHVRLVTDPWFRARTLALRDRTLGCFCAPPGGFAVDAPIRCHGQIIATWLDYLP